MTTIPPVRIVFLPVTRTVPGLRMAAPHKSSRFSQPYHNTPTLVTYSHIVGLIFLYIENEKYQDDIIYDLQDLQ